MTKRPPLTVGLALLLLAVMAVPIYQLFGVFLMWQNIMLSETSQNVLSILYQIALFALPALLYYAYRPEYRPALRLRRIDPLTAALLIVSAFVGMIALNQIGAFWPLLLRALGLATETGNSAAPTTMQSLLMMLVSGAIIPAITEETLMRGLLLPSLEPMGNRRAVLLSALLFALMHLRIESLPVHFLLGCVLALVVLRTGSLFSSMLYHVAFNASLIIVVYFVAVNNPESLLAETTMERAIATLPIGLALTGIWLLLTHTALQRGERKRKDPLPDAERVPLTRLARILLIMILLFLLAGAAFLVWAKYVLGSA